MYIDSVNITNCLGLNVEFYPHKTGITTISGPNGSGKSNILLALQMALCGRLGCKWPDVAVSQHADEGSIEVVLRDCEALMEPSHATARLDFREKGAEEEFSLLDSTGEPCPEPRTTLRRLRDTANMELRSNSKRHSENILEAFWDIEPREFKTYLCYNGSCLDPDTYQMLHELAVDRGLQIIMELHHQNYEIDVLLPESIENSSVFT